MTIWHHGGLTTPGYGPLGNLASHVYVDGTQHVFYIAADEWNVFELWWKGSGPEYEGALTTTTPNLKGDPSSPHLVSHVVDAERTQHVFYRAKDKHIYELWWSGGERPPSRNLTPPNAAFPPNGAPLTSHVSEGGSTQHVFYPSGDPGHIIELSWQGLEDPQPRDLNTLSGAPIPSVFAVTSHVYVDGTQHLFYPSFGDILELWWTGDEKPLWRNLTKPIGAPRAANSPISSHVFDAEGTQHVFYKAENGDVIELWWRSSPETPNPENLTQRSGGAPAPAYGLTSHVFDFEGTQHVFYRDLRGHIIELWWPRGGGKQFEDLTDRSGGAPLAYGTSTGDPISHVVDAERTQHVFYATLTDTGVAQVIELWSELGATFRRR